jgi:hypothetical protein
MTAEQGSQGFNPIDQLVRVRDVRREELDRVTTADSLLERISFLMYSYGPVKFFPDSFKYATKVFDPGEYALPDVVLETADGDMQAHVSAKYGDVPFTDRLGEMTEASLHFQMGDQTATFTIPRTDFEDAYNADDTEDVEEEDEDAQISARVAQLPPLGELEKASYVLDLIKDAYERSGLVFNAINPDITKEAVDSGYTS